MRRGRFFLVSLLLAFALALPVISTGCGGGPRYYDPYYHDYHYWGPDEEAYYRRWEGETHRDHREWRDRNRDEQKEYYTWRHSQGGGKDHDKH
jgi:hypothetical protein